MANSDFWRELAISFQSVPPLYEFAAYRQYYMELRYFSPPNKLEPDWKLEAIPVALAEFRAMAIRGATMLPPLPTNDLAMTWLEALWKDATEGPVCSGIPILGPDRKWSSDPGKTVPAGPIELRGKIDRVFQASSALCRKFEAKALQAELEEKQREHPKNWSEFRRQVETFENIKEVMNEPPYQISEAVVRKIIAEIDGIKPEDVTQKRIAFEIAGLRGPSRRHIQVVPSVPLPEAPPSPDAKAGDVEMISVPTSKPTDTVAAQIERLRDECRWTNEELAEAAELSTRQVARHVSGEAMPYKRNIAAYERVFSKKLKRQIVVSKKS
jgi:hypothetical protein